MQRYEQVSEFKERLVAVNRVSKTVKGGRNMRFSALVVVGDENGRVGAGMGKAAEIPEAIRKANEDAKKHMVTVPLHGTTVPHEAVGYYSTGKVVLIPAPEGTGVIAGGAARAVLELAGVKDIRTKSFGTSNRINMVKAKEEKRYEAQDYLDEVSYRLPAQAEGDGEGPGPSQDRPDQGAARQSRHPWPDFRGEAHGQGRRSERVKEGIPQ